MSFSITTGEYSPCVRKGRGPGEITGNLNALILLIKIKTKFIFGMVVAEDFLCLIMNFSIY